MAYGQWVPDPIGRRHSSGLARGSGRGTAAITGAHPVRYTAADDSVFAFVRDPSGTVTLPDVRATPTTAVETIDGRPLVWRNTQSGIEIDLLPARFLLPSWW